MCEKARKMLLLLLLSAGSQVAYPQYNFPENLQASVSFWNDQVEFIQNSEAESMSEIWRGVAETSNLTSDQIAQLEKALFLSRYWVAELERDERQFLFKQRHLAVYLSGFNPAATGKNDRAGIWMLTFPDARRYGLIVNENIDERRDILKSTQAAAKLFKELKSRHGGEAEAMFVLGAAGIKKTTPEEIQKTEADLTAIRILAQGMETKETLLATSHWNQQKIDAVINISVLAKEYEIPEEKFRKMNPMLIGTIIPKNNTVWLPGLIDERKLASMTRHLEKQRERKLDSILNAIKNDIPSPTTHRVVSYRVKSGDVLGRIAEHHGVRVSNIKKWNDLRSDRIDINQKLTIYLPKNKKLPSAIIPPPEPESEVVLTETEKTNFTIYEVQAGDTLWAICKRFEGVKPEQIMAWNDIGEDLSIGQKLKIKTQ